MAVADDTKADLLKVSILGKESIHCGFHLTPYIVQTVLTTLPSSTYVLITDDNIAKLHLHKFEEAFAKGIEKSAANPKPRFLSHVIPPGETSKSREGKARIEDFLLFHKCTRDSVILALGGGVIGDLVGFVAATFMRGVRFCQIPTTLLAMVDSSVGGKTAIDTPHGKNLIGAFWQPEYIFIDAAYLETLPTREFSNGMAEVVKTAAIWDEKEFTSLESRSAELFAAIQTPSTNYAGRTLETRSEAQKLLLSTIAASIGVKAHIVTIDERETGLRNLVNFGHSIGHAIEAVLTPTILHGECVSIGMILEAELSRQLGILTQVGVGRLTRCLKAYNLPTSLSAPLIASLPQASLLTVPRLLDIMRIDKKNSGTNKKIVLLKRIGETYEQKASIVEDKAIEKTLAEAVTVVPSIPTGNVKGSPGEVRMSTPGSKSISNRALVLAALAKGTCRLRNLLHSDDTQVMMAALHELKGAVFTWEDGGETLVVEGGEGTLTVPTPGKELYLGNAGTAARFLTTVCALAQPAPASVQPPSTNTVITGNARMKQRPIGPLVDALRANGCSIGYRESEGCLPLSIPPNSFKGGKIQLAASVSSQYVSSILLCAPYAQDANGVTLELVGGEVISQPYIDMTIAMMKTFGVEVTRRTDPSGKLLDIYDIPRGTYVNPPVYNIESDASSATYPLAVAAITGTKCTIENIGSSSLQGDAKFAVEVLQKMGCEVHQTADETTVQGPPLGQLKAIEEVDMEVMTDAFLTASVLAAVANGGENKAMKITGIANQRVKECNRIRAMMDELAKFGVHTTEQELGLTIYAVPISQLKKNVSVHCYDDHRVAMAFSVLSTVVEGAIIEEKRCVEKTWPGWWDDLENKIGIKVEGVDLAGLRAESSSAGVKESKPIDNSSILLIGMRGTGKTHIGQLAAASLPGWSFVDADHYFESKLKTGVKDFVKNEGWEKFREEELAVLAELIGLGVDGKAVSSPSSYSKNHVISLGGGIVETPAARSLLKAYLAKGGRVVHITRPIDEIVRYLNVETARPAYEEPILDVWKRREPWYKECSGWEFGNVVVEAPQGQAQAANVEAGPGKTKCVKTLAGRNEVKRFFGHLAGINPNFTHGGSVEGQQRRTYFLCLTYPDVRHAFPYIDELTEGADALELRVDLLKDAKAPEAPFPSVAYVKDQVTALRRVTGLPIIYTVRTKAQGGAFPDGNAKEYKELVEAGVRLGVEYLDVEVASIFSDKEVADLSKRTKKAGSTLVIASWHDWSGKMQWDGEDVKRKYDEARKFGDLVKIVGKAEKLEDNFKLLSFVKSATSLPNSPPIIAINMSTLGQSSRILNTTFTPVSHPLLPTKAAPGQLSFKQIQQALHLLGLLPSKHFHLFGTPIAHSMSPTLHNTGFELLGLPFKYGLLESKEVDCKEVRDVISDKEGFGGASVTIPFKVDVIELLDELTESAKEIGAVNTIIPVHRSSINAQGQEETTRVLVGDNTDWVGIRVCITQRVSEGELRNEKTSGLVIGAGGTARAAIYALQDLGVPVIYLFNRTKEKAEELAKAFVGGADKKWNGQLVVLDKLGGGWGDVGVAPRVIVSTVPASATALPSASTAAIAGQVDKSTNQIVLPADVFAYTSGSAVVVDMAYKPAETPLLKLAKELKEEGNWACVQGLEVLLEQGYVQFEKWTGRRCPKEQVSTRVWEKYGEV